MRTETFYRIDLLYDYRSDQIDETIMDGVRTEPFISRDEALNGIKEAFAGPCADYMKIFHGFVIMKVFQYINGGIIYSTEAQNDGPRYLLGVRFHPLAELKSKGMKDKYRMAKKSKCLGLAENAAGRAWMPVYPEDCVINYNFDVLRLAVEKKSGHSK